jgi:hypothetical protein
MYIYVATTTLNADYTRYLFLNAVLWCLKELKRIPTVSNNRTLLGTASWYCSRTALRHQNCGVPYCPVPSTALRHQNWGVPYCPVPSTALRHQNCGVPNWPVLQLWYTSLPGHFVTFDFPPFNCRLLKPGVMLRHSYGSQPWLLNISLFICNPVTHSGKQATRPAGIQLVNEMPRFTLRYYQFNSSFILAPCSGD